MLKRLLLSTLLLAFTSAALAQIETGDGHWENRAADSEGGQADPREIGAAISAYEKTLKDQPKNLEARWKLVRALRFKAAYVVGTKDARREVLAEAKAISSEGVSQIERSLTTKGVRSFKKANEEQIAKAAKPIPNSAALFYWDSVAWGEWGVAYGKLAAVRQGAAERIRKSSTVAMLIDPNFDGGGGARVLGRLHNQTPRVPFLTGWASDKLAVRYLRESLSRDPSNKLTKVFLAEAMVANDSDTKPQAVALLREVINSPNALEMLVENMSAQEDAIILLERWGAD